MTAVNYLGTALDTTYTRDDPAVTFSKGHLTAIPHHGTAVEYRVEDDTWTAFGPARSLMHEFYELWLIRVGGYPKSQMGAGPAHDMADRFEEHIPMERCCPCD